MWFISSVIKQNVSGMNDCNQYYTQISKYMLQYNFNHDLQSLNFSKHAARTLATPVSSLLNMLQAGLQRSICYEYTLHVYKYHVFQP